MCSFEKMICVNFCDQPAAAGCGSAPEFMSRFREIGERAGVGEGSTWLHTIARPLRAREQAVRLATLARVHAEWRSVHVLVARSAGIVFGLDDDLLRAGESRHVDEHQLAAGVAGRPARRREVPSNPRARLRVPHHPCCFPPFRCHPRSARPYWFHPSRSLHPSGRGRCRPSLRNRRSRYCSRGLRPGYPRRVPFESFACFVPQRG